MVKFYSLNLMNTLLFEARPLLEHLPYEEGIKTLALSTLIEEPVTTLEHLPYEEGIKTFSNNHWHYFACWNTYPMKRVLRRPQNPEWKYI